MSEEKHLYLNFGVEKKKFHLQTVQQFLKCF